MSIFEILFKFAVELRTDERNSQFTAHHSTDKEKVITELKASILTGVMPEESADSEWGIFRIFARNLVNRAQAPMQDGKLLSILNEAEGSVGNRKRLETVAKHIKNLCRQGLVKQSFADVIINVAENKDIPGKSKMSYLQWLATKKNYWAKREFSIEDNECLIKDLKVLYHDRQTKLSGMGLPLAANLFADLGVSNSAKPDLHVTPIINLLFLGHDEKPRHEEVFQNIRNLTNLERQKLKERKEFRWINRGTGLMPRHLDRILYLIGSDNFLLNGQKNKHKARVRRQLIVDQLVKNNIIKSLYHKPLR